VNDAVTEAYVLHRTSTFSLHGQPWIMGPYPYSQGQSCSHQ